MKHEQKNKSLPRDFFANTSFQFLTRYSPEECAERLKGMKRGYYKDFQEAKYTKSPYKLDIEITPIDKFRFSYQIADLVDRNGMIPQVQGTFAQDGEYTLVTGRARTAYTVKHTVLNRTRRTEMNPIGYYALFIFPLGFIVLWGLSRMSILLALIALVGALIGFGTALQRCKAKETHLIDLIIKTLTYV